MSQKETDRFAGKYRVSTSRLKDWDYSSPGYYFVTICTRIFQPHFGKVIEGVMKLDQIGEIAFKYWVNIPEHFSNAELDEFVIMSNHMHGIVIIHKQVETQHAASLSKPGSLSAIIRSYKSAVTLWARQNGYPAFAWQTRFYDHIINNDESLHEIRYYIRHTPLKWDIDQYNPQRVESNNK